MKRYRVSDIVKYGIKVQIVVYMHIDTEQHREQSEERQKTI